jgi:hypothetical protein
MSIKLIPLSRLEADPKGTLNECLDSVEPLVVELPDHRLVSTQGLAPNDDDDLIDRLLDCNPSFKALAEKSKASPRRPFPVRRRPDSGRFFAVQSGNLRNLIAVVTSRCKEGRPR